MLTHFMIHGFINHSGTSSINSRPHSARGLVDVELFRRIDWCTRGRRIICKLVERMGATVTCTFCCWFFHWGSHGIGYDWSIPTWAVQCVFPFLRIWCGDLLNGRLWQILWEEVVLQALEYYLSLSWNLPMSLENLRCLGDGLVHNLCEPCILFGLSLLLLLYFHFLKYMLTVMKSTTVKNILIFVCKFLLS